MKSETVEAIWKVPSPACELALSPVAFRELARDLVQRGSRACGILLGYTFTSPEDGECRLTVENTLPLDRDEQPGSTTLLASIEALEDILLMWLDAPRVPGPIGVYVVHADKSEEFCREQLPAIRKYFRGETQAVICLQSLAAEAEGHFVASTRSGTAGSVPVVFALPAAEPLPVKAAPSGAAAAPALERISTPGPVQLPVPERTVSSAPVVGSDREPDRRWVRWLAGATMLLIGLGIGLWWSGTWKLPGRPEQPPPAPSQLDLRAARSGADLEITWNRGGAVMQSARRGFLYITDGDSKSQVFLEEADLRTGRVLYVPRSADVEVRLEVVTPEDRIVRESLRIIQAAAAAEGVPAPVTPPAQASSARRTVEPPPTEQQAAAVPNRVFVPPTTESSTYAAGTARIEAAAPPSLTVSADLSAPGGLPLATPQVVAPPAMQNGPEAAAASPAAEAAPRRLSATASDRLVPQPTRQASILIPPALRNLLVRDVTISIRVRVDESGRVSATYPPRANTPAETQLINLATTAARDWRFLPATRSGQPVASDYILNFRIKR